MSIPIDQHYVSAFSLRPWEGSNGRLWRYHKLPDGRIIEKPKPASKVAYEKHLNTLPGTRNPGELEEFLGQVESAAAPGIAAMRDGTPPSDLAEPDKKAFAQFVHALLERHPERVRMREGMALDWWQQANAHPEMGPMLRSLPAKMIEEHLNPIVLGRAQLATIIRNSALQEGFINWQWVLGDFRQEPLLDPPAACPLVTSDRPVIRHESQGIIYAITLALSPTKLFIAHPPPVEEWVQMYGFFGGAHNALILDRRPKYIFSSVKLTDDMLQPGGFTMHFHRGMREYLEPTSHSKRGTFASP